MNNQKKFNEIISSVIQQMDIEDKEILDTEEKDNNKEPATVKARTK